MEQFTFSYGHYTYYKLTAEIENGTFTKIVSGYDMLNSSYEEITYLPGDRRFEKHVRDFIEKCFEYEREMYKKLIYTLNDETLSKYFEMFLVPKSKIESRPKITA